MNPHTRMPSRRRRARGMTLIEVLCAILVMTVGLLGLVSLMARASQATGATEDAQRAAVLANEIATEMWLAGTITLPAATVTAWQTRVAAATDQGLPSGTGTITSVNQVARITITWTPPSGTARQYFTDVRLNN
ncbi:type IV pilus modification PilV family protein [Roseateles amylovorans]|uniref:Prepilin-type N-terminal cleavage/methylation domain-containing protein n=1 Tax=Roseateles amylovorans TaxID=2978473 RepID=A0ABY6B3D6_9BURK|nr:prepilin-type N-terminal cleavage/methylation domain-containing protein [Roseateles amylovorans]UXH79351.1 prepilin-type N-terminal cleavage/methylation domain-containing protein [Roseateles amylovorans]